MKILHYSDRISTDFSALYQQCDVLITTGDLDYFSLNSLRNMEPKKPALGIYGNHDAGTYLEELNIFNLHLRTIKWGGYIWGGFEGCPRYKNGPFQYSEEEATEFANTFPAVDILLLHAGPHGMLDDETDEAHHGSLSIKRYVLEKQPKYVFVGHQYSNDEMEVGQTKLFRTYGARLIEI